MRSSLPDCVAPQGKKARPQTKRPPRAARVSRATDVPRACPAVRFCACPCCCGLGLWVHLAEVSYGFKPDREPPLIPVLLVGHRAARRPLSLHMRHMLGSTFKGGRLVSISSTSRRLRGTPDLGGCVLLHFSSSVLTEQFVFLFNGPSLHRRVSHHEN